MSDIEDREEREKKRKKRMRDLMVHLQAAKLRQKVDIDAPSAADRKPERSEGGERGEECTKKLATVYKSIELRRREATDRWNRFAGTSGGGGRGR